MRTHLKMVSSFFFLSTCIFYLHFPIYYSSLFLGSEILLVLSLVLLKPLCLFCHVAFRDVVHSPTILLRLLRRTFIYFLFSFFKCSFSPHLFHSESLPGLQLNLQTNPRAASPLYQC